MIFGRRGTLRAHQHRPGQEAPGLAPMVLSTAALVADPGRLSWAPFRPGVWIHRLYGDGHAGTPAAALLRYEPGASIPRHRHPGFEHIVVLSGAQTDERGRHEAGAILINTPGSAHTVTSPEGCLVLAYWERPVEFIGDAPSGDSSESPGEAEGVPTTGPL